MPNKPETTINLISYFTFPDNSKDSLNVLPSSAPKSSNVILLAKKAEKKELPNVKS